MSGATHAYTRDGQYFGTYEGRTYMGDQYLEDLLRDERGNALSLEQAKAIHPHYTLVLAALNSEVRRTVRERRTTGLDESASVFISYRWESRDLRLWVGRLAAHLRNRNYRVECDYDEDVTGGFLAPARFMARMARCSTVAMILTEQFANAPEDAGHHRIGWVLDEQMLALKLQAQGLVRLVFIEKERGYRLFEGLLKADVVVPVHGIADPWKAIDEAFPRA